MNRRYFCLILCIVATFSSTKSYAGIRYTRAELDDGTRYLLAEGEFARDDQLELFLIELKEHQPAFIVFNSPGGNIYSAMALGRLIRNFGLNTVQVKQLECTSACALAFVGGVKRDAAPGSVGVHKSSFSDTTGLNKTDVISAIQGVTADVIGYLGEMGVDPVLLEIALQYESWDIRYLSASEMQRYRVTTSPFEVELPPVAERPNIKDIQQPTKQYSPEKAALAFATAYHRAWSQDNNSALKFMNRAYGENVSFYGKTITKADLMGEKRKFAERWPIRKYAMQPGSAKIVCGTNKCSIEALVEWYAESRERGKRASGVAQFILEWNVWTGTITSETGRVLRANR